jgi:uncharacterized protein (DUF58 family)
VVRRVVASREKSPWDPYTIDWGAVAPLKLRAATIAEGLYAGMHRSVLKGSGVEFAGPRPYVRGDDLRFVDKRSLLRHDRLMIREFETETDRALYLVVDATASMAFRGGGPASKYPFAALLALVLARVALDAGDPTGLLVIGGREPSFTRASSSRDTFDRLADLLVAVAPAGDWALQDEPFGRALAPVLERAPRGSIVVLFSDLVDLPDSAVQRVVELATRRRRVFATRVLSPEEAELPFDDQSRFVALEGNVVVEASPVAARRGYLAALASSLAAWDRALAVHGGAAYPAVTTDDPVRVASDLLLLIRGLAPTHRSPGGEAR